MLDRGIIEPCEVATDWNTKALPVVKGHGVSCRLVGDWRGLNTVLKKLLWHTESCDQLIRHKGSWKIICGTSLQMVVAGWTAS